MKVQYQAKIKCSQCKEEALWCYSPRAKKDDYFCDACVPRGCSCNLDQGLLMMEISEETRDELGRLLPCCEYGYCEEGFDDE